MLADVPAQRGVGMQPRTVPRLAPDPPRIRVRMDPAPRTDGLDPELEPRPVPPRRPAPETHDPLSGDTTSAVTSRLEAGVVAHVSR